MDKVRSSLLKITSAKPVYTDTLGEVHPETGVTAGAPNKQDATISRSSLPASLQDFATDRSYDATELVAYLSCLVASVISRHFTNCPGREDLRSVGMGKALQLLRAPHADFKRNISTFLYTGIRNEITNYVRREVLARTTEPALYRQSPITRSHEGSVVVRHLLAIELSKIIERFREVLGTHASQYDRHIWRAALFRAAA